MSLRSKSRFIGSTIRLMMYRSMLATKYKAANTKQTYQPLDAAADDESSLIQFFLERVLVQFVQLFDGLVCDIHQIFQDPANAWNFFGVGPGIGIPEARALERLAAMKIGRPNIDLNRSLGNSTPFGKTFPQFRDLSSQMLCRECAKRSQVGAPETRQRNGLI